MTTLMRKLIPGYNTTCSISRFSVFSPSESQCDSKQIEDFVPATVASLSSDRVSWNNNKVLHRQKDSFELQTKSQQFDEAIESFDVPMEILDSRFTKLDSITLSTHQTIAPELSNSIENEGRSRRQKFRSFSESQQSRAAKSRRKCKSAEIIKWVRI